MATGNLSRSQVVAANFSDFHRRPFFVLHQEHMTDCRATVVTRSIRLSEVFVSDVFPAESRGDLSMFSSVTPTA